MFKRNKKGQFVKGNKFSYWLGKKMPEEMRKKMSESGKGHFVSEETKRKISQSKKGKKLSKKHKEKLSLAKLRLYKQKGNIIGFQKGHPQFSDKGYFKKGHKPIFTPFVKGHIPWHKGLKGVMPSGKNHHNWKGGITSENEKLRRGFEYKEWARKVKKRDNYICWICEERGKKLHSHHLKDFSNYPKLRFVINNGLTLCEFCHKIYTKFR